MAWKIKDIWRDHEVKRGKHAGQTHRAFPEWNDDCGAYDTYPAGTESSNRLADAESATSIDELYHRLDRGLGVRCTIPTLGTNAILVGHFHASFEQG